MLILAMVVAGAVGFLHLPVDRYPAYDLPTISVRTELPGASPEEVEVTISHPLEEAVNTVAGITELRSISFSGVSLLIVTFDLKRDTRSRTSWAAVVSKFDSDSTPCLSLAM